MECNSRLVGRGEGKVTGVGSKGRPVGGNFFLLLLSFRKERLATREAGSRVEMI